MSYSLKSNPPCKDCKDRHMGCHAKCSKYIDWDKARQVIKDQAYKKYMSEKIADDYTWQGIEKSVTAGRKRTKKTRYKRS